MTQVDWLEGCRSDDTTIRQRSLLHLLQSLRLDRNQALVDVENCNKLFAQMSCCDEVHLLLNTFIQ